MKFTKFDVMGKCYLLFSLPASCDTPPELAATVCHDKQGASADGAVFLLPSLAADYFMVFRDREGRESVTHEALRCVGSYLSSCARLPLDEYTIETSEGVFFLKLFGIFPHEVYAKCGKCKQEATKDRICVNNAEHPIDILLCPQPHVVLCVDDADACDLSACRGALLREGTPYATAPLVAGELHDGTLRVRAEYFGRGILPPYDEAIAAALFARILRGECRRGEYYAVSAGSIPFKIMLDSAGAVHTLGRAEVLFHGEYVR